jgi:hypothetical protein
MKIFVVGREEVRLHNAVCIVGIFHIAVGLVVTR